MNDTVADDLDAQRYWSSFKLQLSELNKPGCATAAWNRRRPTDDFQSSRRPTGCAARNLKQAILELTHVVTLGVTLATYPFWPDLLSH
jgi:hypothetical protein